MRTDTRQHVHEIRSLHQAAGLVARQMASTMAQAARRASEESQVVSTGGGRFALVLRAPRAPYGRMVCRGLTYARALAALGAWREARTTELLRQGV